MRAEEAVGNEWQVLQSAVAPCAILEVEVDLPKGLLIWFGSGNPEGEGLLHQEGEIEVRCCPLSLDWIPLEDFVEIMPDAVGIRGKQRFHFRVTGKRRVLLDLRFKRFAGGAS